MMRRLHTCGLIPLPPFPPTYWTPDPRAGTGPCAPFRMTTVSPFGVTEKSGPRMPVLPPPVTFFHRHRLDHHHPLIHRHLLAHSDPKRRVAHDRSGRSATSVDSSHTRTGSATPGHPGSQGTGPWTRIARRTGRSTAPAGRRPPSRYRAVPSVVERVVRPGRRPLRANWVVLGFACDRSKAVGDEAHGAEAVLEDGGRTTGSQ